jgi:hypothetical protein
MNTQLTNEMIDELIELSLDEMDAVTAGRKQEQGDKIAAPGEQAAK